MIPQGLKPGRILATFIAGDKSPAYQPCPDTILKAGCGCIPRPQLRGHGAPAVCGLAGKKQLQILRLTTPELKSARGPVRSGWHLVIL